MKRINDFMTIPVNAVHSRSRMITDIFFQSLVPVLIAGGADNLLQNLLIFMLQHVAEWLQLATLIKACTVGLKIGLVVYFIRFSYRLGNKLTMSAQRQASLRPDRGVTLIPFTNSHLAHLTFNDYTVS